MKCLVTGGAGFIGSHMVDSLLEQGHKVIVFDNMSTGKIKNIKHNYSHPYFKLVVADLDDINLLSRMMGGVSRVYHIAAHADVRDGIKDHFIDIKQNLMMTMNVLEAMKKNTVKEIVYTSTSSVYGEPEPKFIPTPETYFGVQTSLYGASKVAAEQIIMAYANYYNMNFWIFRLVSQMGERYSHGVIIDFLNKLKESNYNDLFVLGDGSQKKSYLYVKDLINAINIATEKELGVFNVGNDTTLTVKELLKIVFKELKLKPKEVAIKYGGGKRGWKGDSPNVLFDTKLIRSLGWYPKITTEEAIKITTRWVKENVV